ncbi:hypothetical protein [Parvularcula maris]|uniref:DoxX family protein n=1 Tax=Parvularcula maris TaxID=2965077 RepID=A0A9X2L9V9_9PROT|nr:hypothetical protein [Parvularcula maris]MCQ8185785.1 hypothetical protein [Parvularcula maris]
MGSILIILARALIVSPFLITAVMAGLDYSAAASAFADTYPQLAAGYPVILGVQVLLGLIVILGLPGHRIIAALVAVAVVAIGFWVAPFWNMPAAEMTATLNLFVGHVAQAGGLLLIAVMNRD